MLVPREKLKQRNASRLTQPDVDHAENVSAMISRERCGTMDHNAYQGIDNELEQGPFICIICDDYD